MPDAAPANDSVQTANFLGVLAKVPLGCNHVEIVLFRLLQESLTNAHRHSRASIVNITLENNIEEVIFEVHDNGQGIAPELLSRLPKKELQCGRWRCGNAGTYQ